MATEFETSRDARQPLLEAEKIRVEFGDLVAVRDVSLKLHGGELLGLIGPNGAGKTTLLRALAGLQAPDSGRTLVMGHNVFTDDKAVRRQIGMAPEAPPLYEDLTVRKFLKFITLAYGIDSAVADERIDFWLDQLWLTEKTDKKIATLSRGMRQRVTVARTLVPNPWVIFLDEPSGGLDPAGRIQFRKVLASLRDQGKALIVSSHILADLEEYCTHIAIIEHGSMLRFGAVGELHGRAAGRSRYSIRLAQSHPRFDQLLESIEGVSGIEHVDGTWTLEYDESPSQAAELLKSLIAREVAVASFGPVVDDLEQMYLSAGVKQVD